MRSPGPLPLADEMELNGNVLRRGQCQCFEKRRNTFTFVPKSTDVVERRRGAVGIPPSASQLMTSFTTSL